MKKVIRLLSLVFLLLARDVVGQTVAPPLKSEGMPLTIQDIETAYKGRLVLQRTYYRGNHLIYNEDGLLLMGGDVGTWTLDGHIEIEEIKARSNRIEIDGVRVIATCDRIQRKWHGLPIGKVRVEIELNPGNLNVDKAKSALLKVLFPPRGKHRLTHACVLGTRIAPGAS